MNLRAPHLLLAVAGLVALRLPTLSWGFGIDDYTHQAVLRGLFEHPTLGPWSLFDFGGPPRPGEALFEAGGLPFWIDAGFRARFLRPLTSAWIALDHALFGEWAAGYHATQLALFALLLLLLAGLWRRLGLAPSTVLLALLIFGLEDGSTAPVGWIANRSTLLVCLGLVGGLSALARGSAAGTVAGGLLALGAKESGVGVLAVLGLAALAGLVPAPGGAPPVRRPRLGAALLFLALGYAGAYFAAGYGTRSSFYPTPWTDPSTFGVYLGLHATAGLATAAGPVGTDLGLLQPELRPLVIGLGALVVALLARPVARSVRELPAGRLFGAVGVLTFLPQVLATPSDRLAFVPLVGWAPLLAGVLERGLAAGGRRRFGSAALAASALLLSPLGLVALQKAFGDQFAFARATLRAAEVGPPALGRREALVLQAPLGPMMLSAAAQHALETGDGGVRWWPLQNGRRGLVLRRAGPRTLEMTSTGEAFFTKPFEYVYRTSREPPAAGTTYRTAFFRARVTIPGARGVRSFTLEAEDDLDAPHVRFLAWDGERMRHVPPPAVGESLTLPEAPEPFPFAP